MLGVTRLEIPMVEFSQWFFSYGWFVVSAIGFALTWRIGLIAGYFFVIPCVVVSIMGK
jgi:hypothetical protein